MEKTDAKRVLIIDDEELMRKILIDILEINGYSVIGCEDGTRGINEFQKEQFDAVITDMIMPKKDGMETIIKLKEINPDIRIIAMSGAEHNEMLLTAADIFEACVTLKKPFKKEDLLSAVRQAISQVGESV